MEITILTEPVGQYYNVRTMVKKIIGRDNGFGGHPAVTRSLVSGLKSVPHIKFNYRPRNEKEIFPNVHVLAGVKTLRYALRLKREGKIKHLTAGPNIVTFSTDCNEIVCNKEIELFLQPSQWAADLFVNLSPSLKGRCIPWAAGIDIGKYTDYVKEKNRNVLIYHKEESEQFCYRIQYLVRQFGYDPIVIKYGQYRFDDYLEALSKSHFMISVSRQESQGIFLAEAWAMNVPTICYDPHYYHWAYDDQNLDLEGNVSTCPYLSDKTGVRFETFGELYEILRKWDSISSILQPRKWVEENMTDEVCAQNFVELLKYVYE